MSATVAALAIVAIAWLLWRVYLPAKGLTWQFDDLANLKDLAEVSSQDGFINFVFGGVAGPSGRPLSLLAFVPNYVDWSGNPWGFVEGNLLLHGLNGLLAFLLFSRLWAVEKKVWRSETRSTAAIWGAVAAILWVALAIHATSILMPVQRMTQVSAFFVLATLWVYVLLRQRWVAAQGWWPLMCLSAVVAIGTGFAALGKESGALTMGFVAVIETLWLRRYLAPPTWRPLWRIWVTSAWLVIPIFLVYWYLIRGWTGLIRGYQYYRPFNLEERLATEPIILWEYLRQILAPRAALLGPFHDGHTIYNWSMWQPWVALLAWLVSLCGIWLWTRHRDAWGRAPWLAIVFFLVAHQIESTFIPLELYFEHRNYLATLGLAFAAAAGIRAMWQRAPSGGGKALAGGVLALAVGWQLQSAHQVSSAFGNPWLGAELWHQYHPDSARATQTLAWQLGLQGFAPNALKVMDEFSERNPDEVAIRVQALSQSCALYPDDAAGHHSRLEDLQRAAGKIKYSSGLVTGLRDLGDTVRADGCQGLNLPSYLTFLQTAASNEAVQHSPQVRHHINFELSLTMQALGRNVEARSYAQQAFFDFPSFGSGRHAATLLFQDGKLDDAIAWASQARDHAPRGVRRWAWEQYFLSMQTAFEDINRLLTEQQ